MAIYYIILISTSLLNKLNNYITIGIGKKKVDFFYGLSFFILLFFAFFRSASIGKDTYHYKQYFQLAINAGVSELPYEIGFDVLTKLFQRFSDNFETYLSFLSVITLVPIIKVLKKESANYLWLTMYIFVSTQYVSSFSILRGYIALALIMVAYSIFYDKDKKMKFLLISTLAVLFHYSSIIYLVVFFFGSKRYKITHYLMGICLAIILYLPFVAIKLRTIVVNIISLLRPQYSYFTIEYDSNSSVVFISIYGIIVLLSLIYSKKILIRNNKNNLLINMSVFMLIFNLAMSWFPAYTRISSGFLVFMSLLIPEIIAAEKSREIRLLLKILFCIMFFIYMRLNLSPLYSVFEFR